MTGGRPLASRERQLVLIVVLVGQFMIVGAVGSMNIALPAIRDDLHASPAAMQWVLVLYQLGYSALLVTGGRLGDLLGRKRVFVLGITGFVVASAIAAVAPNTGVLIAARLLQGVCGGVASPQVLSVIQVAFPPSERPRAFAAFGMVSGSAFMVGQVLSGALINLDIFGLGWRSVLVLNLVLGAGAIPAAIRVLPATEIHAEHRLDLLGMMLGTASGILVLYPLIQGRAAGWPPALVAMLVAAAPLLVVFVRLERRLTDRGAEPLVDMDLFRERSFRAGLLVAVAFGFTTLPTFYVLTLTLQLGFEYDALTAALATTPTPLAVIGTSMLAGRLLPRYGRDVVAFAAGFAMLAAIALMVTIAITPRPLNPLFLVPALLLQGCGNGFGMTAVVNLTLVDVPEVSAGSASGVLQTVQQGTSAIGVAIAGLLFFGVIGSGNALDDYVRGLNATLALTLVCGFGVLALHRLLPPARPAVVEEDLAVPASDPALP